MGRSIFLPPARKQERPFTLGTKPGAATSHIPRYSAPEVTHTWVSHSEPRFPETMRLSPLAFLKLQYMCHNFDVEVGSFGISRSAKDLLYVEEIHLVKQVSNSAHVDFDDDGIADYIDEMVDKGLPIDQISRLWFHTHPVMSASPSGTDESTFATKFHMMDWAVMAIISKTNDMFARLKFNCGPGAEKRLAWEVDWARWPEQLRSVDSVELEATWKAEFEAKVQRGGYQGWSGNSYPQGYQGHQGYQGDYGRVTPSHSPLVSDHEKKIIENPDDVFFSNIANVAGSGNKVQRGNRMDDDTDLDLDAIEWNEGILAELGTEMGQALTGMYQPTDQEVFERFLQNRDWIPIEESGTYEPKHGIGMTPTPKDYETVVGEFWFEVIEAISAFYPEISIPSATVLDRKIWQPEPETLLQYEEPACQLAPSHQDQSTSPTGTSGNEISSLTHDYPMWD